MEILNRLNRCYPFADERRRTGRPGAPRAVNTAHRPPGASTRSRRATPARLGRADDRGAGGCSTGYAAPACPDELTAPVLHRVLDLRAAPAAYLGRQGRRFAGRRRRPVHRPQRPRTRQKADRNPRARPGHDLPPADAARGRAGPQGGHPSGRLRHAPVPGHQGDQEGAVPRRRPRRDRQAGHPRPSSRRRSAQASSEVVIIVQESDLDDFRAFFNVQVPIENFNKLSPPVPGIRAPHPGDRPAGAASLPSRHRRASGTPFSAPGRQSATSRSC